MRRAWLSRTVDALGRTLESLEQRAAFAGYGTATAGQRGQNGAKTLDYRDINRKVIEQFRTGGEIEGMHRDRLVLLTTTGARTGRPHTTPMMFQRDGDRLIVIASNAGAPRDPDWYRNLVSEPRVTVEVGEDRYPALASVLTGADHALQWAALKQAWPFLADHEKSAGRVIPLVALTRLPAGD